MTPAPPAPGRRWARLLAMSAAVAVVVVACTSEADEGARTSEPTTADATSEATSSTSPGATDPTGDAEPSPEEADPRSFTVVVNGDMLLHSGLWETAQTDADRTGRGAMDFRPLLANMRPVVSGADLAICHMETPLAPRGGPYSSYPVFSVPPQIVPALKWAGYDACTTASNHSIDQGFDGLTRTIGDFDEAGIAHTGTFGTRAASKHALLLDVAGTRVALISATYGTNGIPLPSEEPWSVNLIKPDRIIRLAERARDDGAEVVLVALHWGLEYTHEPTAEQEAVADELTRSAAIDLVYGHHAHVVQPYDKVNGTWVLYGQGNAVAQQLTEITGVYDGNTARITFTERPDGRFRVSKLEYIPTMITYYEDGPMRYLNVPASLADPRYADLRDDLRATEQRVTEVIGMEGALRHGVVEGG